MFICHHELDRFPTIEIFWEIKNTKDTPTWSLMLHKEFESHTGVLSHPPTLWEHRSHTVTELGIEPYFLICPMMLPLWACPVVASQTPLYCSPLASLSAREESKTPLGEKSSAIRLNIAGRGCISFGLIILSPIRRTKSEEFQASSFPFLSLAWAFM